MVLEVEGDFFKLVIVVPKQSLCGMHLPGSCGLKKAARASLARSTGSRRKMKKFLVLARSRIWSLCLSLAVWTLK